MLPDPNATPPPEETTAQQWQDLGLGTTQQPEYTPPSLEEQNQPVAPDALSADFVSPEGKTFNPADSFYSDYDQNFQPFQLQPETPQDFMATWKSATNNKPPDPLMQVIPDDQWDYKTATTDKQGQPLPYGATGFDPYGRAYYGEGLQGWLNGAWSRITDPGARAAKFDFSKENTDLGTTVSNIANNVEQAGNLTDSFGVDSPLTPILRTIKEGVNAGFQAMSLPAVAFERVVGTASELLRTDRKAADLNEAWQASAITYSSFFDVARRDLFIEGMRAGKNPEFLAMELENPIAEMAGQFVLDPLWIAGGLTKGAQAEKALTTTYAKATKTGVLASEDVARLVSSLVGRVDNDIEAAGKLERVSAELTKAVEATKSGMQSYKPGLFSRVTNAEQTFVHQNTSRHVEWLVNTMKSLGHSPDDIGNMLYHTALLASDDAAERAVGLSAVLGRDALHAHPVPSMALSDDGLQSAATLYKAIGGDADGFLKGLSEAQKLGPEGIADFANQKMLSATKEMYPSVTEMRQASEIVQKGGQATAKQSQLAKQYDTLSYGVKQAEKFAEAAIPKTYRKIQGTMVGVYLSSPGTAMRNLYSNIFHGFVDQGAKFAVGRNGKVFAPFGGAVEKDIMAWTGGQKVFAEGFGAAGAATEEAFKVTKIVPKLNDAIERGVGNRVIRASLQDSMEKLLQPGKFLPDVQPLLNAGMSPEQATMFTRYVLDAQGDVDKAILRLRGTAEGVGQVSAWQDTSRLVNPKMRDFMHKLGIHDEIIEAVHGRYNSADEAVQAIVGHIRETVQHHADGAADDIVDIDKGAASYGTAQNIAAAVHEGHVSEAEATKFTAMLQQGHTLENYLDQVGVQLANLAPGNPQNVDMISTLFGRLKKAPGDIAKETQRLTDQAWDITNRVKGGGIQDVSAAWSKYLPDVPFPEGATGQQLVDEIWKSRRATVDSLWRGNYDNLKKRSDELFDFLLPQIADPSSAAQAQALRAHSDELYDGYTQLSQAVYDGKNFYPKSSDVNAALSTAEQQAMDELLKSDSALTKSVLTAKENGVNTFQLQNHFKKTGEKMTPELVDAYIKSKLPEGAALREVNAIAPPYVAGKTPSQARVAQMSQKKLEPELQRMEQFIRDNWGETLGSFGDQTDAALAAYAQQAKVSIAEARNVAIKVAHEARDFTLLPYATGKTGMDAALSYVYPLGFWPTRTYANWGKRVWTDPAILASYAKYRQTMEKVHADMPEFYRNNINPAELLGIETDNPIFLNLEATLWPLNGMTGVDFNDPYKRVDWWTATLDDASKLGAGGVSTNISALTAIALYMRGEKEAASRWAGRLFPQTAQVKAALSLGNVKLPDTPFTKGNEVDPFVNFFSGGDDPYERRRFGTALMAMEDNGEITHEQALDAAQSQSGDIWEKAKQNATKARAVPTLASWGLGVGWKPRTATDLRIEKFYGEYSAMNAQINGGALSADATRQKFDELRKKYPFMDLVILSKKDGFDRDRAYAYSALSRLPPGSASDLIAATGLNDALVQKFYDDKGRIGNWPESDRQKFMAGMNDLAAVFAIPDDATQADWNEARRINKTLGEVIKQNFGADITDKMDGFFAIGNETQKQRDQQNAYLKQHPEVSQAMDFRSAAVAEIPQLNAYYGGIDAVDKYYTGKMYADIKEKLGADIFDKFGEYGNLKLTDPDGARAYYNSHPELAQYSKLKESWQFQINQNVASVGAMLQPGQPAQLRPDIAPTTGTEAVQNTFQQQTAPQKTWADWAGLMPESLQRIVLDYFQREKDIPKAAEYNLERLASDYGYGDTDALLQAMGASYYQVQRQP